MLSFLERQIAPFFFENHIIVRFFRCWDESKLKLNQFSGEKIFVIISQRLQLGKLIIMLLHRELLNIICLLSIHRRNFINLHFIIHHFILLF